MHHTILIPLILLDLFWLTLFDAKLGYINKSISFGILWYFGDSKMISCSTEEKNYTCISHFPSGAAKHGSICSCGHILSSFWNKQRSQKCIPNWVPWAYLHYCFCIKPTSLLTFLVTSTGIAMFRQLVLDLKINKSGPYCAEFMILKETVLYFLLKSRQTLLEIKGS